MIAFVRDLIHGEPVMFVGAIGAALSAWTGALVAAGEIVPLWLAIVTPVWLALGAVYARHRSTPVTPEVPPPTPEEILAD